MGSSGPPLSASPSPSSPIRALGFSGSLRKGSFNAALLQVACEVLPEGMTLETFDLSPIPLYNPDLEAEPEAVISFKQKIAAADALVITIPEYNYSIPGVLKNAIDWASRPPQSQPFNGKPVAIMGAGGSLGTARAQLHMRQIGVFLNMHIVQKPEVQIQFVREKFNPDGTLKDDKVRLQVQALMDSLAAWTRQLRGY